ncbi:MAG: hypothetical protein K6G42_09755 [Lachnospiraceae bacterium]|nr:hypothetical protein [Lachnospiraceae bacterium]
MSGGNYDRSHDNAHLNPAVAYAFALQVEAAFFVPLRSVRVFTKENEFDYYQEGGLNDYVHMLRKPISKPFTFQVERYVGVANAGFNSGFVDPLALGTDLILPLVLYVNRSPAGHWYENINFKNCARAYIFTGCTVTSKEYGELNGEQSKLLTETTTIAYKELFTLNQLNPAWESGGLWQWKEGDFKGGGTAHTENRSSNDSKSQMEQLASSNRWDGDKDNAKNVEGKGKRHLSATAPKMAPKSGLEQKGKSEGWAISKDDYKGNSKFHTREEGRKNDPKSAGESKGSSGAWAISRDAYAGNGKFHTREEGRRNDPKSEGESRGSSGAWAISGDAYAGNGNFHTREEGRRNDSKSAGESRGSSGAWAISGDAYAGNGNFHTREEGRRNDPKSTGESQGKANTWGWDGSVNGSGKSHTSNRNVNKKPVPVTYPPTRRALKAEALSKQ